MIATSAATRRIRGIPQSEALHVVERFTPVDANTIVYRVTIDDKNVYTKPWTVEMPLDARSTVPDVRVRVPGGELRDAEHPGGRPRGGARARPRRSTSP